MDGQPLDEGTQLQQVAGSCSLQVAAVAGVAGATW